jgi:hypothetical protein
MRNFIFLDNIKKGFWLGFGFSLSNNATNKVIQTINYNYDDKNNTKK